jgi:ankyrin repeat protein
MLVVAGGIVCLLVLLFFSMTYIYRETENNNFAKLRIKSKLNCKTMPLHCLVRDGDIKGISQYAEDGKDLELKDKWGRTALYWAMTKDKESLMTLLLSFNADPNTTDENGRAVFYQAIAWDKYEIADRLLESGADINAYSDIQYPETSLHHCVMKDNSRCVQYLLENGADITLKDSFGYTVLDRVKMHKHIGSEVTRLIEK